MEASAAAVTAATAGAYRVAVAGASIAGASDSGLTGVGGFCVTGAAKGSWSEPRRRFAGGLALVSSSTTTDGFAAGAFAGDGCLKKNDVMGFSAFFALPPPGAGLPRFILARPARSQPLARPTMAPAQIWRRVSFPQPSLNVPRHAKNRRMPSGKSSESASSPGLEILLPLRKRHLGRMFAQI